jgi:hypothetical protein
MRATARYSAITAAALSGDPHSELSSLHNSSDHTLSTVSLFARGNKAKKRERNLAEGSQ